MKMNEIIIRILTRTNSYEDLIEFTQWLSAENRNLKEFKRIKSYWSANARNNFHISVEDSFKKLQLKMNKPHKKSLKRKKTITYCGIAASLLIILTIVSFLKVSIPQQIIHQYTCMTENGISTFYMQDSTKIILNKNSMITYTNEYGKKERRVKLIGEAYFEVTKNEKYPFIVDMNETLVQVLGTKFTVNNRPAHGLIETILLEGSVRFTNNKQSVLMNPNQKLSFHKNNMNLELIEVDSEQEIAWKDGLFKYRSLPFDFLMKRLEIDYKVKIILNNKILYNSDLKFTGSFERNMSFDKVLNVINRTIKIKWKEKDGIYYIY